MLSLATARQSVGDRGTPSRGGGGGGRSMPRSVQTRIYTSHGSSTSTRASWHRQSRLALSPVVHWSSARPRVPLHERRGGFDLRPLAARPVQRPSDYTTGSGGGGAPGGRSSVGGGEGVCRPDRRSAAAVVVGPTSLLILLLGAASIRRRRRRRARPDAATLPLLLLLQLQGDGTPVRLALGKK